jgi:hypothetical protein
VPLEESAKERAVKDLVGQARHVLPVRESSVPIYSLPQTERALHLLADAIERLVDSSIVQTPIAFCHSDKLDLSTPDQIEALYDSITDRTGQSPSGRKKFVISFPDVELSISDIWSADATPDDPTPEDVIEAMQESEEYAQPAVVAHEWNLIESLKVRCRTDEAGTLEVEWDGS